LLNEKFSRRNKMRSELDIMLVKDFPNLYRDRYAGANQTCMCWGIDVGDGWFKLISDLSYKLEKEILKLDPKERENYCASQVKEKFATLRFYMTQETKKMAKFISEAEEKSAVTCENCGKKGKLRGSVWVRTLCIKCHRKNQAEK
jgi:hypothetical protein